MRWAPGPEPRWMPGKATPCPKRLYSCLSPDDELLKSPVTPGFCRRLFITLGLVVELQPDWTYGVDGPKRALRKRLRQLRQPPCRKSFYAIGFGLAAPGVLPDNVSPRSFQRNCSTAVAAFPAYCESHTGVKNWVSICGGSEGVAPSPPCRKGN